MGSMLSRGIVVLVPDAQSSASMPGQTSRGKGFVVCINDIWHGSLDKRKVRSLWSGWLSSLITATPNRFIHISHIKVTICECVLMYVDLYTKKQGPIGTQFLNNFKTLIL